MVKKAQKSDLHILAGFASQLFGDTLEVQTNEIRELLKSADVQFFISYENKVPVGFAQCQLRHDYVEGTDTSPVGYLEGIFVQKEYRQKGYAKEMLSECEAWARSKGCLEFASDCEINNENSIAFHKAMHFYEANRIVCFTKHI